MYDDVVRITTKLLTLELSCNGVRDPYLVDMLLYPFEEEPLIEQSNIEVPVVANLLAGEKAPKSDPVVEVDEDDVVVGGLDKLRSVPIVV